MSTQAKVLAYGPFSPDIVGSLAYPAEFYSKVQKGYHVITELLHTYTRDSSLALAQACGVEFFDPGTHDMRDGCSVNVDALKSLAWEGRLDAGEKGVQDFLTLRQADFQFFFYPDFLAMGVKPKPRPQHDNTFDPRAAYERLIPTLTVQGRDLINVFVDLDVRMRNGFWVGKRGWSHTEIPDQRHYLFHGVTDDDLTAILRAFPMTYPNLAGLQDFCAAEKRKRMGLIAGWFFQGWYMFEPLLFEIVICRPEAPKVPVLEGEANADDDA